MRWSKNRPPRHEDGALVRYLELPSCLALEGEVEEVAVVHREEVAVAVEEEEVRCTANTGVACIDLNSTDGAHCHAAISGVMHPTCYTSFRFALRLPTVRGMACYSS